MANPQVSPPKQPFSPAEQAELKKLQEEEDAKREALAAVEMQKQAASAAAVTPPPRVQKPQPKQYAGDIPVTCLRTESFCNLGGRKYNISKGTEIMMDPSHAHELSLGEKPWVAPVTVHQSR